VIGIVLPCRIAMAAPVELKLMMAGAPSKPVVNGMVFPRLAIPSIPQESNCGRVRNVDSRGKQPVEAVRGHAKNDEDDEQSARWQNEDA
jgi:hypothetical protein